MLNDTGLNIAIESPSVFFIKDPIVKIGDQEIKFLKEQVQLNSRKTARLCMHKTLDAFVQEMLIIHLKETYVRPHKHIGKSVSYHIIEGEADMVLFNERGNVIDVIPLGEFGSKSDFYYRLDEELFYTPLVRSDFLVFHETIKGPFTKAGTIFAQWAPVETDLGVRDFKEKLISEVDQFKKEGKS